MGRDRNVCCIAVLMAGLLTMDALGANPCVSPAANTSQSLEANVASPPILSAWIAKYPTSTLPARMAASTGSSCNVCHQPSGFGEPGNCYRAALIDLLGQGLTPEQAIDQLDPLDSDGDGVPNGEEATTPRPEPNEIGYNMGLIGDAGTDPCAVFPTAPVTGVRETPPVIPAVSTWGLVVLAIVQAIAAAVILRLRQRAVPEPLQGDGRISPLESPTIADHSAAWSGRPQASYSDTTRRSAVCAW